MRNVKTNEDGFNLKIYNYRVKIAICNTKNTRDISINHEEKNKFDVHEKDFVLV